MKTNIIHKSQTGNKNYSKLEDHNTTIRIENHKTRNSKRSEPISIHKMNNNAVKKTNKIRQHLT